MYLRPEVKIEPLVCGWYAWTHLLSPAQHALNVVYRHLPLLQSFVKNPEVHLAAAEDPKLFGGPFVHLPRSRVPDVRRLIDETLVRCARLISMGRDLRELDCQLQASATGYSMSEFYSRIPTTLSGLAELVYDLNNHPKLRLYEELLYEENPGAGTEEIMLSPARDKDRTFFMSTPRLASEEAVLLPFSFADRRLDTLVESRTRSINALTLADTLEVPERSRAAFIRLFTTSSPCQRLRADYHSDGVRIRYFGHACVLIQTKATSILIDPMVATESDSNDGRYTICDLPERLDYVVLSHNHQDHCVAEMLIQLRPRIRTVVVPLNTPGSVADPSMALMLKRLGFQNITTLSPFEQIHFADGNITSLPFPGEHADLDISSRQGLLVVANDRRLAFLVDSDGRDTALYRRISKKIGRQLDAIFIGMECHGAPLTWLYGPLLTKPISRKNDESRRLSGLNCERAWGVLQEFEPNNVFVYAMGQEPWLRYIMGLEYEPGSIQLREIAQLLEQCNHAKIKAEHLYGHRELEL